MRGIKSKIDTSAFHKLNLMKLYIIYHNMLILTQENKTNTERQKNLRKKDFKKIYTSLSIEHHKNANASFYPLLSFVTMIIYPFGNNWSLGKKKLSERICG